MEKKSITTNSFTAWVAAARPKTLSGAAVPVMVGLAYAVSQGAFTLIPAVLCLLFAFFMQIDANFVNDYFDFLHGNDDEQRRLGPLRACSQGWVTPQAMKVALALTTTLSAIVGLPLAWIGGWEMIVVGAACIVFCFLYTLFFSYRGMGDLLVLVFFGLVPVCFTAILQGVAFSWQLLLLSFATGMVVDTLLVVNNYRDRDLDKEDGKITLVVRIGSRNSELLYLMLGIVSVAIVCVLGFFMDHLILLPVLYLPLHYAAYRRMIAIKEGRELNYILGLTARNMFIFGLLTALHLII